MRIDDQPPDEMMAAGREQASEDAWSARCRPRCLIPGAHPHERRTDSLRTHFCKSKSATETILRVWLSSRVPAT